MPVFDFSSAPVDKKEAICTYTTFQSNNSVPTSFEFNEDDGIVSADILKIDSRFVSLLKWLGENHINVRLSGENNEEGYAVYKIRF